MTRQPNKINILTCVDDVSSACPAATAGIDGVCMGVEKFVAEANRQSLAELLARSQVLVHIPGQEIRTGDLGNRRSLNLIKGQLISFVCQPKLDHGSRFIPVNLATIPLSLEVGDIFTMGDGRIAFQVESLAEDRSRLVAKALCAGCILAKQSIHWAKDNLVAHGQIADNQVVSVRRLTVHERRPHQIVLGDVRDADIVTRAQVQLSDTGVKVLAEIASGTGIENLAAIAQKSDGIVINRRQLVIDMGDRYGAHTFDDIVGRTASKPIIVRGAFASSMLSEWDLSAADREDIAVQVRSGVSAIMLGGVFHKVPDRARLVEKLRGCITKALLTNA
ncbi:MAG: hypothetical protein HY817_02565 [Candidatus Abawacabacteria bacterium]|nr:hypothetical protein [Candidatus Abawacabacteria bacterium]